MPTIIYPLLLSTPPLVPAASRFGTKTPDDAFFRILYAGLEAYAWDYCRKCFSKMHVRLRFDVEAAAVGPVGGGDRGFMGLGRVLKPGE